ncbi:MAG: purine-nucleoside phosphorylase [Bacilli bacterium]|nr:purine-nucleoside phosphorylase [Bacilli bacterium]
MSTPHIESNKEDIAKKVIMPGDPERAKYIAETFLKDVKLVNRVRGENAYTGNYKGQPITVFSSGMGIPSMGIYSHELFSEYDVDYIIRLGTAGSYKEDIKVKDIFIAESAYSGTSFDESSSNENTLIVNSSPKINSVLIQTAEELGLNIKTGRVHTTEAFYGHDNIGEKVVKEYNASVVEMETYSLLFNAKKFHKDASAVLTISDNLVTKEEMSREERVKRLNTSITLVLETIIKL